MWESNRENCDRTYPTQVGCGKAVGGGGDIAAVVVVPVQHKVGCGKANCMDCDRTYPKPGWMWESSSGNCDCTYLAQHKLDVGKQWL